MKIQVKTVGPKGYANLSVEAKALALCNIDGFDWDYWAGLGLTERQVDRLRDKYDNLDDDKWLVVSLSA